MAVDFALSNTTRHYSIPDNPRLSLPNRDWTWAAIIYKRDAVNPQYIISNGNFGIGNTFNMYHYSDADGNSLGIKVDGLTAVQGVVANMANDTWHLVYGCRRDGVLKVGHIQMGIGNTVDEGGAVAISAAYDSPNELNIGRRQDGATTRYFQGGMSDAIFIPGYGFRPEDARFIARGKPMNKSHWWDKREFHAYFPHASSTYLVDLTRKYALTRVGTGFTRGSAEIDSPARKLLSSQMIFSFFPEDISSFTTHLPLTGVGI